MEYLLLAVISGTIAYVAYQIGQVKGEAKGWDEAKALFERIEGES